MYGGNQHIVNLIRREVHRVLSGNPSRPRYALITGYNPDKHLVKATIQPEGHETAWFPIGTDMIGNGWGLVIGPQIGDQIEVVFQEGDPSSPRMNRRVFSDEETPPRVESGEAMLKHKDGSRIYFKNDGHIYVEGGPGKKVIVNAPNIEMTASEKLKITGNVELHGNIDQQGHIHSSGEHRAPEFAIGGAGV